MLRSLLVGLIAIAVAPACKSGGDAPTVQPGVTAGKVIEVEGVVTATRGGEARELKAGSEISGDDVIHTSDGASVRIWLSHNNATWDLGAGRTGKVGESAAWTAAKVDHPPPGVDEATVAAGRHAEKSAADTASSAMDGKRQRESEPAAAATEATPPKVEAAGNSQPAPTEPQSGAPGGPGPGATAPTAGGDKPEKDMGAPSKRGMKNGPSRAMDMPTMQPTAPTTPAAPPPPPPTPPPAEKVPTAQRPTRGITRDENVAPPKAAMQDDGVVAGEERKAALTIASIAPSQKAAMAKCLEASSLKVVITVKAHVVTFSGGNEKTTKCLAEFAPKFQDAADGSFSLTLTK